MTSSRGEGVPSNQTKDREHRALYQASTYMYMPNVRRLYSRQKLSHPCSDVNVFRLTRPDTYLLSNQVTHSPTHVFVVYIRSNCMRLNTWTENPHNILAFPFSFFLFFFFAVVLVFFVGVVVFVFPSSLSPSSSFPSCCCLPYLKFAS